MAMISWFLLCISLILLVPTLFFFMEVVAAVVSLASSKSDREAVSTMGKYAVLIPAHNEEKVLGGTLDSLRQCKVSPSSILVVADNCSDATAEVARSFGVRVLSRIDPVNLGKGYALAYGVKELRADPPDVLIILDADCVVADGCFETFASQANEWQQPIQAKNLMEPPQNGDVKTKIASLAFTFKNHIRPLGLKTLGLPCLLTGTGMALPWALVMRLELATANIVEDMQLGIDCALFGQPPRYYDSFSIVSKFPESDKIREAQRKRWEHGHLQTIFQNVPALLKVAVKNKNHRLLALCLELAVPPLTLLGLLCLTLFFAGGLFLIFGTKILLLPFLPLVLLVAAIFVGWFSFCRELLDLQEIVFLPHYLWKKMSIYLGFIKKREKSWIKTKRD